jgi:hypothetical protein
MRFSGWVCPAAGSVGISRTFTPFDTRSVPAQVMPDLRRRPHGERTTATDTDEMSTADHLPNTTGDTRKIESEARSGASTSMNLKNSAR